MIATSSTEHCCFARRTAPGTGTWPQPGARWHWRQKLMAGACAGTVCAACVPPAARYCHPAGALWYFKCTCPVAALLPWPHPYLLRAPAPCLAVLYVMFLSLFAGERFMLSFPVRVWRVRSALHSPLILLPADLTRDETRHLTVLPQDLRQDLPSPPVLGTPHWPTVAWALGGLSPLVMWHPRHSSQRQAGLSAGHLQGWGSGQALVRAG